MGERGSLILCSLNLQDRVQEQRISGNQDSPEGGFDGFLQSIVCTDLIGWREVSRKLLLYITDAGFHYANDGKVNEIFPADFLSCVNDCIEDMATFTALAKIYSTEFCSTKIAVI